MPGSLSAVSEAPTSKELGFETITENRNRVGQYSRGHYFAAKDGHTMVGRVIDGRMGIQF
jgi:hypothetical protein